MHEASRKSIAALGIALAFGLGSASPSRAHDGHDHGAGPRGGALEMTKHYHFEVVFTAAGFKVFPYGMDGKPLDTTKLSGKATFYHPNTPKPWFDRPLSAAATSPGRSPVSLDCTIDLSKVPTNGTKVTFEVSSLPDPVEPSASFTVPFALTQAPPAAAVRPAPATIAFASATRADQPAINAQRVCKVSGESLGSMGVPIKVTRGNSSVFLCCQGCIKKVQANPDLYLGAGS
jgi:hypothetical protein